MLTTSTCASVLLSEVYFELAHETGLTTKDYLSSLGYCGAPCVPNFRVPSLGDTYLTPEGKIATKEKGDKGPYGPRLIVVEDLTESERTYGKGIKTGADALAKCRGVSAYAVEIATGVREYNTSSRDWTVAEFRRITSQDSVCFIRPEANALGEFEIVGTQGGDYLFYAKDKPVYIVRPKPPRYNLIQQVYGAAYDTVEKLPDGNEPDYEKTGEFRAVRRTDEAWLSGNDPIGPETPGHTTFNVYFVSACVYMPPPTSPRAILRKKQPRKKRVLVFDFDEVAKATGVLYSFVKPGMRHGINADCYPTGARVRIEGVVEERDA